MRAPSIPTADLTPSSEAIVDLIFALGLLWKSVESLSQRLEELERHASLARAA
jgi:hypothetical protein